MSRKIDFYSLPHSPSNSSVSSCEPSAAVVARCLFWANVPHLLWREGAAHFSQCGFCSKSPLWEIFGKNKTKTNCLTITIEKNQDLLHFVSNVNSERYLCLKHQM